MTSFSQYWQWRALRSAVIALVPAPIRRARRRRRAAPVAHDGYYNSAIRHGLRVVQLLRAGGDSVAGITVLEIGSGWHPVVPLIFRLAGAKRVILTDRDALCTEQSLAESVRAIRTHHDELHISENLGISRAEFDRILTPSAVGGDPFERYGLSYRAPFDCRRVDEFRSLGSIGLIFSRAVLEQLPPDLLADTFAASARALVPGGLSVHIVDNSDYYSQTDPRLPRLFYLTQTPLVYRLTRLNPLERLNRLRHSDYQRLLADAGLDLLIDPSYADAGALVEATTLRLDSAFRSYGPTDLATLQSWLFHRKPITLSQTA